MSTYSADILAAGLKVVFCGINPASSAAADGHNFSNRSNRFWPVLHLAGFTDVRLKPQDERRLLEYGCGISAVVSRPTQRAAEIRPEEFRHVRPEFEAKMRRFAPTVLAFLGKRAFAAMMGVSDLGWGRLKPGAKIQKAPALFPRIDLASPAPAPSPPRGRGQR